MSEIKSYIWVMNPEAFDYPYYVLCFLNQSILFVSYNRNLSLSDLVKQSPDELMSHSRRSFRLERQDVLDVEFYTSNSFLIKTKKKKLNYTLLIERNSLREFITVMNQWLDGKLGNLPVSTSPNTLIHLENQIKSRRVEIIQQEKTAKAELKQSLNGAGLLKSIQLRFEAAVLSGARIHRFDYSKYQTQSVIFEIICLVVIFYYAIHTRAIEQVVFWQLLLGSFLISIMIFGMVYLCVSLAVSREGIAWAFLIGLAASQLVLPELINFHIGLNPCMISFMCMSAFVLPLTMIQIAESRVKNSPKKNDGF